MELALTTLLWVIVGAVSLGVVLWVTNLIVVTIKTRKVRKMMNKTTTEMMMDIKRMIEGDK